MSNVWAWQGGVFFEEHHYNGMQRLQAPQLHHNEEQEERSQSDRDEEILPVLSDAHLAPGDQVRTANALNRRPVAQLVE
jgi:hypothetical protein